MKRPYLALAALALATALAPAPTLLPRVWAEGLFASAAVEPASFAVLARPVGADDWTLVVLEQLRARPFCWTPRPDGLVDPTLNRFDFTGICGRFIDSNGYSLRIGEADLNHAFRLRLEQKGSELQLLAASPSQGTELLVGRGAVPRRDRDLFVSLQLEPGWELRRRVFGGRSLNHIYFNNAQSLDSLIAGSRGRTDSTALAAPPIVPPPIGAGQGRRARAASVVPTDSRSRFRQQPVAPVEPAAPDAPAQPLASRDSRGAEAPMDAPGPGVVTLQVIPYEERIDSQARTAPATDPFAQAQGL